MPFDSTPERPRTLVAAVEEMKRLLTPKRWAKGVLYTGDAEQPERLCVNGAHNLALTGSAGDFSPVYAPALGALWRAMEDEAIARGYTYSSSFNNDLSTTHADLHNYLDAVAARVRGEDQPL